MKKLFTKRNLTVGIIVIMAIIIGCLVFIVSQKDNYIKQVEALDNKTVDGTDSDIINDNGKEQVDANKYTKYEDYDTSQKNSAGLEDEYFNGDYARNLDNDPDSIIVEVNDSIEIDGYGITYVSAGINKQEDYVRIELEVERLNDDNNGLIFAKSFCAFVNYNKLDITDVKDDSMALQLAIGEKEKGSVYVETTDDIDDAFFMYQPGGFGYKKLVFKVPTDAYITVVPLEVPSNDVIEDNKEPEVETSDNLDQNDIPDEEDFISTIQDITDNGELNLEDGTPGEAVPAK